MAAARGRSKREFTPTQEALLGRIATDTVLAGGTVASKAELAALVGRAVETVDRALADLRRRGYVETVPRHDESGAQLASLYRVLPRP